MLHTLFLPKQGDAEGRPYPASSMALEVTEEIQCRLEGFIEAEIERYADELVDEENDPEKGSDEEGTARGDSDDERPRKKTVAKKPIGDAGMSFCVWEPMT